MAAALLAGASGAWAGACADATDEPPAAVAARDSAGVRIVENPATPVDTVGPGQPLLTLGQEGDPRYEFDQIRFVGALSDGRMVVADGGSSEIRLYGADGTWEGASGRAGDGPGEYRFISRVQVLDGDTLAVLDPRTRRVSYLAPDGSLVGSVSWVGEVGEVDTEATLCGFPGQDGVVGQARKLVLRGWSCIRGTGTEGPVSYIHTVRLWNPDTGASDTVATLPYFDVWERPGREIRERFASLRFTAGSLVVVWSGGAFIPSHRAYRIDVFDVDGHLRMAIRDAEFRRPVTEAIRDAWFADQDSADLAFYEGSPFPDYLPAFDRGLRSDDGFWARHYDVPGATGEHWRVYDDDGVRRVVVAFPEGFTLQSIRGGRAYGFTVDALGVQRPRVYALPAVSPG